MYWQQNNSDSEQQQQQAITPLSSSEGSIGRPFVDDSHILRYEDIEDDENDDQDDDQEELSNNSLSYNRKGKLFLLLLRSSPRLTAVRTGHLEARKGSFYLIPRFIERK